MKFLIIFLGFISVCFCAVPGLLDCVYRCSWPKKPVVNPNNTAQTNGCGAYGIMASTSMLPNPTFLTCCNGHDICYETCNIGKNACDTTFKNCMMNSCSDLGCRMVANSFYGAVQAFGCPAYLTKQQRACSCV